MKAKDMRDLTDYAVNNIPNTREFKKYYGKIMKRIKISANKGYSGLEINMKYKSESLCKGIVEKLTQDGYITIWKLNYVNQILIIKW